MAARSKARVWGRSHAGIVGSIPAGGLVVCFLWVLCVVTRPEESYRLWYVWVWSFILENEVALAHWGCSSMEKKNYNSFLHRTFKF